ncbi:hypothetical protein A3L09_10710 (plasmid) [Thermococcus profundus]|uniref:Uncharacterized protein n=1 Tax=Thermococcus profundus TaxID=49899 RepID=A0A2Z2MN51_THEPR|nr:hypothetical protein [Thermococcus profundus]ASJ03821.1 hypothetical protein A3L09_10710 [Thermococcus profundus]
MPYVIILNGDAYKTRSKARYHAEKLIKALNLHDSPDKELEDPAQRKEANKERLESLLIDNIHYVDEDTGYYDTLNRQVYKTMTEAINSITPHDLKRANEITGGKVKTKLDYVQHFIHPITLKG